MSTRVSRWSRIAVVLVCVPASAYADNCSSLDDCWGYIGAAVLVTVFLGVGVFALLEVMAMGEVLAAASAEGFAAGAVEAIGEMAAEGAVEAAAETAAEATAETAAEATAETAGEATAETAAEETAAETTADEGAAEEGAEEASRGTDETLDRLREGRNFPNREVDTPEELERVFKELSEGGEPFESKYPGEMVKLEDGTRVGIREASKSGGRTIDVFKPDGTYVKVHLP